MKQFIQKIKNVQNKLAVHVKFQLTDKLYCDIEQ